MAVKQPNDSKDEFAHRGQELYERDIRSKVEAGNKGKFLAIDIGTGAYEVDSDDYTATEHLLARCPDAQIWLMRIGYPTAYRIGSRQSATLS